MILIGEVEFQLREVDHTLACDEQLRRDQQRKSSREMENETIRILLERQKEQILADFRTEIQKHEFQADSDRRSIQELNGIELNPSEEQLIILLQVVNNF